MTVTVWGECGGPNTIAAARDRYGRVLEAHSYRDLDLVLPAEGVEIDCDHDGDRVGSLVFAELGADERLRAVAVLDSDGLQQVDQPVYFSPLYEMRGGGHDRTYIASEATLLGLSITFATARLGAHPIQWRAGDIRESLDRRQWPNSWRSSDPLLERAHDASDGWLRLRSARTASHIVDRRPRAWDGPPLDGNTFRAGGRDLRKGAPGRILRVS